MRCDVLVSVKGSFFDVLAPKRFLPVSKAIAA